MKLLAFLHIAAVVGLQNLDAVYVWGSKYLSDDELKELTAADKAEMSFIRVGNRGSTLVIDSVQRGSDWVASKSFCSLLLPAVIRDYVKSRRIDFESEIMRIKVINAATPRVAGCKCYARTMIEFGFSSINGKEVGSDDEFCSSPSRAMMIATTTNVDSGASTMEQIKLVDTTSQRLMYPSSETLWGMLLDDEDKDE